MITNQLTKAASYIKEYYALQKKKQKYRDILEHFFDLTTPCNNKIKQCEELRKLYSDTINEFNQYNTCNGCNLAFIQADFILRVIQAQE